MLLGQTKWGDILTNPEIIGPPPRVVSDELFSLAFSNKDNQYIAKKEVQKFTKRARPYDGLSSSQVIQVIHTAIFNTLRLHNFSAKNKFTTSLVTWVQWDAKKEININRKSNEISAKILKMGLENCNKVGFADKTFTKLDIERPIFTQGVMSEDRVNSILSIVPLAETAEMIRMYVIEGYSIKDIVKQNKLSGKTGVSYNTVKLQIQEGLAALRENLKEED